jgi:hypothetical protein
MEQKEPGEIHISVFPRLRQMSMITLPAPRRAQLRAFWLLQSACATLLVTIAGGLLGGRRYLWLGIVAAVLFWLCGFWRPSVVASVYGAWERCAEWYAKAARSLVLKICYYVVFAAVGRVGSRIERDSGNGSLWLRRSTLPAEAYASQCDVPLPASSRSWAISYLAWARASGNFWAAGLLPFLILIAALDTSENNAYPAAIYTLF